VMFLSMLSLVVVFVYFFLPLKLGVWWTVVVVVIAAAGVILSFGFICIHRQTLRPTSLQVTWHVSRSLLIFELCLYWILAGTEMIYFALLSIDSKFHNEVALQFPVYHGALYK
jgi:hypothetical protein